MEAICVGNCACVCAGCKVKLLGKQSTLLEKLFGNESGQPTGPYLSKQCYLVISVRMMSFGIGVRWDGKTVTDVVF